MSDIIAQAKASTLAFNDKDWDRVAATCTSDLDYHEYATGRNIQGVGQVIEAWQGWALAFPDAKAEFHQELASGDTAVFRLTWNGTHTGPMHTADGSVVPATGKTIAIPAVQVNRVVDGKMVESHHYFDMMTMLTQLGLAG